MKFLRLALAYLLAFAPVAEALTPMQRRVLAADQSPLANIEAFRSYVRSQKPTLFLDPDYVQSVTQDSVARVSSLATLYGSVNAFTQSTDANKPVLSRPDRVENLNTYSETFTDASWTKSATSFSGNTLTANAGTASHNMQNTVALVAGGTYRCILDIEKGNYQYAVVGDTGDGPWHVVPVDLTNGTLGAGANVSNKSITTVSSNRYIVQFEFTRTSGGNGRCAVGFGNGLSDVTIPSTTLAGAETIKIYTNSLQRSSMQPTYIATTTVPVYGSLTGRRMLTCDGTDDKLASTSISSAIFGSQAKEAFVLLTPAKINVTQDVFSSAGGWWTLRFHNASGILRFLNYDGTNDTADATVAANVNYASNFYQDSTNIGFRTNNNAFATTASGATADMTTALNICAYTTAYYQGQLGPIITFNRVLPQPVRDTIRAGMQKFWRVG